MNRMLIVFVPLAAIATWSFAIASAGGQPGKSGSARRD